MGIQRKEQTLYYEDWENVGHILNDIALQNQRQDRILID